MKTFADRTLAIVQRLTDGKLTTPIDFDGTPKQRIALAQLEKLRQNMLASTDERSQLEEKNKTAVASVAHDLKTPLAIISGYAESLQDGMNDKDYLSLIIQKTEQMNALVLTLVDAAQQEIADRPEQIVKVDTREFFGSELTKYYPVAAEKKIKLKIGHIPKVTMYLNRQKMGRVVQNIITNAIKYGKEGGRIKVRYIQRTHFMAINVSDNGIGISKQNLPYIFDKFFVGDKSRSTSNSGLGLYIAKEIIEQHGGTIKARSKKGQGSTFIITLPIVNAIYARRKNDTDRFEAMPKTSKFFIFLFFGWLMTWIYRFMKYSETHHRSTLAAGFLLIPLFVIGWFADLISILVCNEINFCAD